jgi:uncharacterized protein (DUF58 family)
LSLYFLQRNEWQNLFLLCFSGEEKPLLFRAAIFAKQKTNTPEQKSDRHIIKPTKEISYATPDSTRGRVDDGPLRADHCRLFMLYWAARASDALITPLVLNESSASRT